MSTAKAIEPVYTYAAYIVRWVDGDTVDMTVDLGFHLSSTTRFRLYGIDTPERGQANHDQATTFMETHAPISTPVVIKTYKSADKYGRWLAQIFVGDLCLNDAVLDAHLAKPYFGGSKADEPA